MRRTHSFEPRMPLVSNSRPCCSLPRVASGVCPLFYKCSVLKLGQLGAMQVHAVLRVALAVPFAALAAAEPYFNCPKGAYLNYQRRATATFDLARCGKACPPLRPQSVHPPAQTTAGSSAKPYRRDGSRTVTATRTTATRTSGRGRAHGARSTRLGQPNASTTRSRR